MADVHNSFDPPPAPQADSPSGFASFFATTTGKLVVGAVALILVVGIVGAIAWAFLFNGSAAPQRPPTGATIINPASSVASASSNAISAAPIVEPAEKPLGSTFTFRNVFAPTLKEEFPPPDPATASSTTASSGSSTSGSSSSSTTTTTVKVPKDTLYLQSIQTVNSSKTATFIWNGTSYTLKEGESIPDSPWKVLSIGDSSVVMLFGDTQVTLSTGQGLTK